MLCWAQSPNPELKPRVGQWTDCAFNVLCHYFLSFLSCRYPWVCLVRGCVPFPRLGKFSLPFSSLFLLRSLLWECYYAWWCDRVPLLFLLFTIVDFHYPASRTCSSATSIFHSVFVVFSSDWLFWILSKSLLKFWVHFFCKFREYDHYFELCIRYIAYIPFICNFVYVSLYILRQLGSLVLKVVS